MRQEFVPVVTLLVATPVLAVFLVAGGAWVRPVAGMPVPMAGQTLCRPDSACPSALAHTVARRPLEC